MLAQGNALGSGTNQECGALKGRRTPPPFQGGQYSLAALYPGRCPGLITFAPLARDLGVISNGELAGNRPAADPEVGGKLPIRIFEIGSRNESSR